MTTEPGTDRTADDLELIEPDAPGMTPADDPIVAEVRAVREGLFAAAGYDLDTFVRQVRETQARSGHVVVTLPPKPADNAA